MQCLFCLRNVLPGLVFFTILLYNNCVYICLFLDEYEVTVVQYSFRGGLRLDPHKKTRNKRVEILPHPKTVTVPILAAIVWLWDSLSETAAADCIARCMPVCPAV